MVINRVFHKKTDGLTISRIGLFSVVIQLLTKLRDCFILILSSLTIT